jgi:hypothetical protein
VHQIEVPVSADRNDQAFLVDVKIKEAGAAVRRLARKHVPHLAGVPG